MKFLKFVFLSIFINLFIVYFFKKSFCEETSDDNIPINEEVNDVLYLL